MKWYLLRYRGQDSDINLDGHTPEFSEWKWLDMQDLVQSIVAFKRPLYQQLVDHFGQKTR